MRVTIDYEADLDSLGVYLDDGTEIGRYCIVNNPEQERAELESMLHRAIAESTDRLRQEFALQLALIES